MWVRGPEAPPPPRTSVTGGVAAARTAPVTFDTPPRPRSARRSSRRREVRMVQAGSRRGTSMYGLHSGRRLPSSQLSRTPCADSDGPKGRVSSSSSRATTTTSRSRPFELPPAPRFDVEVGFIATPQPPAVVVVEGYANARERGGRRLGPRPARRPRRGPRASFGPPIVARRAAVVHIVAVARRPPRSAFARACTSTRASSAPARPGRSSSRRRRRHLGRHRRSPRARSWSSAATLTVTAGGRQATSAPAAAATIGTSDARGSAVWACFGARPPKHGWSPIRRDTIRCVIPRRCSPSQPSPASSDRGRTPATAGSCRARLRSRRARNPEGPLESTTRKA